MKKLLIVLLLICCLSACAGQTESPIYPPIFIPSATFTPSPTHIPLSAVNLDYVLMHPFKLPDGTLLSQVRHEASSFDYLPTAQSTASVDLYHGATFGGTVTVFLYGSETTRARAYQMIRRYHDLI